MSIDEFFKPYGAETGCEATLVLWSIDVAFEDTISRLEALAVVMVRGS